MRLRTLWIGLGLLAVAVLATTLWLFGVLQPDIASAPQGDATFELVPVADGFDAPVQVVEGPGGLHVVEQGGLLKRLDGTVVLDLRDQTTGGGERGFLSAVWRDGWFTHHTDTDGDTVVSSWPSGEQTVLWTHPQPYSNHNGGMLTFGPDGMLYLGLGDGGLAADPQGNGQDTDTHLGGILRFDVSDPTRVQVPADNPFTDGDAPYLFHYGLRNPWRFSFDAATGDLWIGDVGQGNVEEIDRAPEGSSGLNFGWVPFEGSNRFRPGDAPGHVKPIAEYDHDGGHCSVTGGHVIRDGSTLDGTYVFGDYCSGQMWTFADGRLVRVQDTDLRITSFGQGADGTVYVVDHGGAIYRIQA